MSRYYIEITEPAEKDLYKIGYYIAKEFLESGIAIVEQHFNIVSNSKLKYQQNE